VEILLKPKNSLPVNKTFAITASILNGKKVFHWLPGFRGASIATLSF